MRFEVFQFIFSKAIVRRENTLHSKYQQDMLQTDDGRALLETGEGKSFYLILGVVSSPLYVADALLRC